MTSIIILPLKGAIENLPSISDLLNDFNDRINTEEIVNSSNSIIINSTEEKICSGIKNAVLAKFGFKGSDVHVSIKMDKTELSAIKVIGVDIILTNNASWANVKEVKKYMENLVGVDVYVYRK